MVIPQSSIIGFFIAGLLPVLFIIGSLLFLRRQHKFRFTAAVLGFAAFYLCFQVLTMYSLSFIGSVIPGMENLQNDHSNIVLFAALFALMQSIFLAPILYLAMRWVRRGNWSVYDAVAVGISYNIYNAFNMALTNIRNGRIADIANKGELESLVSEEVTIDVVNQYVEDMKTFTIFDSISEVLGVVMLTMLMVLVAVLVYHGMKRKNFRFVMLAAGIQFVTVFLSCIAPSDPMWLHFLVIVAMMAALAAGIVLYFRWYRKQQILLAQQRKEFKERKQAEYKAKIAAKEAAAKEAAAAEKKAAEELAEAKKAAEEAPEEPEDRDFFVPKKVYGPQDLPEDDLSGEK